MFVWNIKLGLQMQAKDHQSGPYKYTFSFFFQNTTKKLNVMKYK